ncbi:DUF6893 family small protein [Actinoallomurus liliacearum]
MVKRLLLGTAVAGALTGLTFLFVQSLPDIRRYLKIRRM